MANTNNPSPTDYINPNSRQLPERKSPLANEVPAGFYLTRAGVCQPTANNPDYPHLGG
jgi:hypothetical protein